MEITFLTSSEIEFNFIKIKRIKFYQNRQSDRKIGGKMILS